MNTRTKSFAWICMLLCTLMILGSCANTKMHSNMQHRKHGRMINGHQSAPLP